MDHIFQTSVLIMECIEFNWLCKHMKKIRSSQRAISVLNWVKHRPFPVYIVKSKIYDNRSSRPKVFCKKDVLKNFEIFTRKHLCWSLFLIKLKFCEILRTPSLKNIFLFFFYLAFLSRIFTNHWTAGEGGGHFLNSSLPLSPASQILRH